jgi:hypothetical protein
MTIRYGVVARVTSLASTQAVDSLGRWARRTSNQPGRAEMTGRVEGAPCQVAGTVPLRGPPGTRKLGMAPRVVATSVHPGGATGIESAALGSVVLGAAVCAEVVGGGMAVWRAPCPQDISSRVDAATSTMAARRFATFMDSDLL